MPAQKSPYSTGGTTETFPGSDFTADEVEFLKAMERYQRRHARRYPTWREVLLVLHALGYRKEKGQGERGKGQVQPEPSPPP
ncbi:MAG: hypothetical protein U0871_17380 [Gemmataceae bacterium]